MLDSRTHSVLNATGTRGEVGRGALRRRAVAILIQEAALGDQDSWNALVDRFSSTVWAIPRGLRLNSADAADVFQTTWLRLLENLDRIEQPERVGAWLATAPRREGLRVLRMAGRQIPNGDDFDDLTDPATTCRSTTRICSSASNRTSSTCSWTSYRPRWQACSGC